MTRGAGRSSPKVWAMPTTYFDLSHIQDIRERLEDDFESNRGPFGSNYIPDIEYSFPKISDWETRVVREAAALDTSRIFSICSSLRLKPGYCWRLLISPVGMSRMFAVPLAAKMAPPTWSEQNNKLDLPLALPSFMEAVEGDDSAESYLWASFLSRDIQEWCNSPDGPPGFRAHELVENGPFRAGADSSSDGIKSRRPLRTDMDMPSERGNAPLEGEWEWRCDPPKDWRAQVEIREKQAVVTFYTYSGYWGEHYTRHTDTYSRGAYVADSAEEVIAEGPGGYIT